MHYLGVRRPQAVRQDFQLEPVLDQRFSGSIEERGPIVRFQDMSTNMIPMTIYREQLFTFSDASILTKL
jgi:hypothetical protein